MRLSLEMEMRRQAQEELLRAQGELTLATERAQRANAEKSLYLGKMSHELRLPLSSAAGLADMLAAQGNLEGKALEWALAIGQCAGHMLSVVSSILDMSKIEAGKMQLLRNGGGYLLRWSVEDSGQGLDAASMKALFAEFGSGFSQGGTGLGLAIVKSFSEMMGGRAWAESEPGRGGAFYFEARVKEAAGKREEPQDSAGETWLRGKRVILAEDDDISALVSLDAMERAGASARRASSGAQALALWSQAGADLVLLDMRMPGMDGPESARLLRERGAACPILALTANAFDEDRKICMESGMEVFDKACCGFGDRGSGGQGPPAGRLSSWQAYFACSRALGRRFFPAAICSEAAWANFLASSRLAALPTWMAPAIPMALWGSQA